MSPWVRIVFIHLLPKLLLIERPGGEQKDDEDVAGNGAAPRSADRTREQRMYGSPSTEGFSSPRGRNNILLNRDVKKAVNGINYIVDHVREANKIANVRDATVKQHILQIFLT